MVIVEGQRQQPPVCPHLRSNETSTTCGTCKRVIRPLVHHTTRTHQLAFTPNELLTRSTSSPTTRNDWGKGINNRCRDNGSNRCQLFHCSAFYNACFAEQQMAPTGIVTTNSFITSYLSPHSNWLCKSLTLYIVYSLF